MCPFRASVSRVDKRFPRPYPRPPKGDRTKMHKPLVHGPTFAEMLDPSLLPSDVRGRAAAARDDAPLDPVNLFNITWKNAHGEVEHQVLPRALTGVDANIVVISGR